MQICTFYKMLTDVIQELNFTKPFHDVQLAAIYQRWQKRHLCKTNQHCTNNTIFEQYDMRLQWNTPMFKIMYSILIGINEG